MGISKSSRKRKPILDGTFRICSEDFLVYIKSNGVWEKTKIHLPYAEKVIDLFKAHGNLKELIDKKNPRWLKGQMSSEFKAQGTRINTLPDGRVLDKAFSLFAENLTVHDEMTNDHWDVIYQNPGGTYSYIYTLEKDEKTKKRKYISVNYFENVFPQLKKNALKALYDKEDLMAVPMYTLLKTYMRIGNEIYYKLHKHKGLTTLKRKDIEIKGKHVTFRYVGKDGVPVEITRKFPAIYVERLSKILREKRKNDFVFTNQGGVHPINEQNFKKAFERYCGNEFYPHIVRSYYATKRAEDFLKNNKTATKAEVRKFFLSVAQRLNHKRFDKKKSKWKESWTVTANHYIEPDLVERIKNLAGK